MDGGWVCSACRSVNLRRTDRCYSCHQERDVAEDVHRHAGPPSETPLAVRSSLPGAPPGTAVWTVGPSPSPQAALEAVRRAAADEMAHIDPASVKAWQVLTPTDQLWLAGSFILVGLIVAVADGRVDPGEIEKAYLKTDDIAAHTKSYVVNWAIGIMGDQRVVETVRAAVFTPPTAEPAFVAARAALGKLPKPDRCRMAGALYTMAWHAIAAKNGAPPTPETIELRQLYSTIARLGLDLPASVAWAQTHGP